MIALPPNRDNDKAQSRDEGRREKVTIENRGKADWRKGRQDSNLKKTRIEILVILD
jgi:hypothetical protein